jgi:2-keto-4-pentenoate hydratase/2-oxohepta-3-ene-1,7-dioic acid hydratase in catechol pathway
MKLCRFTAGGRTRLGKIDDDVVVDLSALGVKDDSMRQLLADWSNYAAAVKAAAETSFSLSEVQLEAPIGDPQKFLALGMNYQKHADEAADAGVPIPTSQLWFNKQVSCVNGPYSAIDLPKVSDKLDYEAELAVVIGRVGRHISEDDALDHVAGYMICNDVSVRDWQQRSPTFTLGKSFDTHGPIGPWITMTDEVQDPQNLMLRLLVNGELRQESSTSDMIYSVRQQIAYLSTVMTLQPGDILATGTPSGVGAASGRFLKANDVVRVEIDGLGHIENVVVPER